MTIECTSDKFFFAHWFAEGEGENMLGCAWREDYGTGIIKAKYRFRYFKDDKAFDSKDKKIWFEIQGTKASTEELLIPTIRALLEEGKALGLFSHYSLNLLNPPLSGEQMGEFLVNRPENQVKKLGEKI